MVNIIKSDKLIDELDKYDVILVGTNLYAIMSEGFQRKVMAMYPYVFEANLNSRYGDINKLGTILECKKEEQPTFIICFITKGNRFRPHVEKDYLSYEALEKCLKLVNVIYKGKKVGSTLLGATRFDGNGDKERIIEIFNNTCNDIDITLYDYEPLSLAEREIKKLRLEMETKKKDYGLYREMVRKRKERAKKIKEINGHTGYD